MSLLTRIRTKSASIAWAFGLVLLLLPIGQHAAGAVLCIEADGHMSIEDAVGLSCGPYASPHGHETSSADAVADTHCGDCIDIPIPSPGDMDCGAFRLIPDVPLPALIPVAVISIPELYETPRIAPTVSPRLEEPHNTPLLALRTVVLLN